MQLAKREKNNLLMTGGHAATTALAVVEEIKRQHKDWELFWVGTEVAIEGSKTKTLESEILPAAGVKCFSVVTGRLQRKFTIYSVPSILKIPIGFFQSVFLLTKVRPDVVLSFGGFASFPITLVAKFFGVPIVLHEQTTVAGRASQIEAKFVTRIAISRKSSESYFPKSKCILTGNPLTQNFLRISKKSALGKPPLIYITGGSRGSQIINTVVKEALPKLLLKYRIVHQCGELDFPDFEEIKDSLPRNVAANYQVFSRLSPNEVVSFFEKADVIVSRSGANTVSEIIAAKRPAILIPLPISYLDEQTKNAEFAKKWEVAEVVPQNSFTVETLIAEIEKIIKHYPSKLARINSKISPDTNASATLVEIISKYLK